jgi:hypothetical protein
MALLIPATLVALAFPVFALWSIWKLRTQPRPAFDPNHRITGWGIAHGAAWLVAVGSLLLFLAGTLFAVLVNHNAS